MTGLPTEWTYGAYDAERASQLSGVPVSTVRRWAKRGIVVPAGTSRGGRLWSYENLITLRAVAWLRREKPESDDKHAKAWPAATLREVEHALQSLERRGESPFRLGARDALICSLAVDAGGHVVVDDGSALRHGVQPLFQSSSMRALLRHARAGEIGPREAPDLAKPRITLRIEPGKLSGQPHVKGTRVTTAAIFALSQRGLSNAQIRRLYPYVKPTAIADAIELETSIAA